MSQSDQPPLNVESLQAFIDQWTMTRLEYPGWVVLPHRNRRLLVAEFRKDSVVAALVKAGAEVSLTSAQDEGESAELLVLAVELAIWRYRLSLAEIPSGLISASRSIRARIDPFGVEKHVNAKAFPRLRWNQVTSAWLNSAVYEMEAARDRSDRTNYLESRTDIARVYDHLPPDLVSAYWYEHCLEGLDRFDIAQTEDALTSWPAPAGDPFWRVRRASVSVLVERLAPAKAIITEALVEIRHRLRSTRHDIWSQSREAWARELYRRIEQSELVGTSDFGSTALDLDRFAALRCSPEVERDYFQARLKYAAHAEPAEEAAPPFDLRRRTTRVRFGGNRDEGVELAESYIRFCETVGLVSRTHSLNFADSEDWHFACLAIARKNLAKAIRLQCRHASAKRIKEFLSRTRVAALDDVLVEELSLGARGYIARTLPRMSDSAEDEQLPRVRAAFAVLTRLSSRCNAAQSVDLLGWLLGMYTNPTIQRLSHVADEYNSLFQVVLEGLNQDHLGAHLARLLSLPIPGHDAFQVAFDIAWPEIATGLLQNPILREVSVPVPVHVTESLILAVRSDSPEVRRRAIRRLVAVHEAGVLDSRLATDFATALWSQTDEKGLPSHTGLYPAALLSLPERSPGHTGAALRRWLLREVQLTPSEFRAGELDDFADVLVRLSSAMPSAPRSEAEKVDQPTMTIAPWSEDELRTLLRRCEAHFGHAIRFATSVFAGAAALSEANALLTAVAEVVLPRASSFPSLRKELIQFFESAERSAGNRLMAAVALQSLGERDPNDLPQRVREGLSSHDAEAVRNALAATFAWHLLGHGFSEEALAAPEDLLCEMANVVASRRQPGLLDAMMYSAAVLRRARLRSDLPACVVENLLVGLRYLIEELHYQPSADMTPAHIPYDSIVEYRLRVAAIVRALRKLALDDEILSAWENEVARDPYPEVRRAGDTRTSSEESR